MVETSRLAFENGGPASWAAAAIFVVLLAAWVWTGLRRSRSAPRRRLLSVLRLANLCALALLWLGPAVARQLLRPEGGRLALLVDTSASMTAGREGESRLERVAGWLDNSPVQTQDTVDIYWFDERCTPTSGPHYRAASDGQGTDIMGALETAAAGAGETPTSILLVSDGADTEALRDLPPGGKLPPEAVRRIEALGIPIDTVAVGAEGKFVDLAIEEVAYQPFAYVRNAVELEVKVRAAGTGNITVPVTLEQGGRILDSRPLEISSGRQATAKLKFVPDEIGRLALRVRLPVPEGDAVPENNQRALVMRIVRDKIRVLHVVGRPQWDVRFLREFFKTEPNIDLVSFYILRNLADAPGVSEDELSLIPFPVHQLFGSELDTFDLVILQNFNHAPYLVSFYLAPMADYVRRGGALCMIGGELSFGSGGYGATPLEQVLPVRLLSGADFESGSFHPLPAPDARGHPVLELGGATAWGDLPALDSFNRSLGLAEGAEALLLHPFQTAGGGRAPLLALREVGRGRSAALLTDSLWRWRFLSNEKPALRNTYHRLWQNLVRWLIRDPAMAPLVVETEQQPLPAGQPVRLQVQRRGRLAEGRALLQLRRISDDRVLERLQLEPMADVRQQIELRPLAAGEYAAEVLDAEGGRILGREILLVGRVSAEQKAMQPRPDILRQVSEISGGKFSTLEQAGSRVELLAARPLLRVEAASTSPLLGRAWLLVLLVALWGVEWWLRRRWGFS